MRRCWQASRTCHDASFSEPGRVDRVRCHVVVRSELATGLNRSDADCQSRPSVAKQRSCELRGRDHSFPRHEHHQILSRSTSSVPVALSEQQRTLDPTARVRRLFVCSRGQQRVQLAAMGLLEGLGRQVSTDFSLAAPWPCADCRWSVAARSVAVASSGCAAPHLAAGHDADPLPRAPSQSRTRRRRSTSLRRCS